jgi:hypothetical protein
MVHSVCDVCGIQSRVRNLENLVKNLGLWFLTDECDRVLSSTLVRHVVRVVKFDLRKVKDDCGIPDLKVLRRLEVDTIVVYGLLKKVEKISIRAHTDLPG